MWYIALLGGAAIVLHGVSCAYSSAEAVLLDEMSLLQVRSEFAEGRSLDDRPEMSNELGGSQGRAAVDDAPKPVEKFVELTSTHEKSVDLASTHEKWCWFVCSSASAAACATCDEAKRTTANAVNQVLAVQKVKQDEQLGKLSAAIESDKIRQLASAFAPAAAGGLFNGGSQFHGGGMPNMGNELDAAQSQAFHATGSQTNAVTAWQIKKALKKAKQEQVLASVLR